MQYDPSKSIQENKAQLQRSGRADPLGTSEADAAKTAVHDLLLSQRRARTQRPDISHAAYQARTAAMKPTQPAFKVREPDPSARATLQRRQSYIPDLKKRQLAKATAVDSPQDFLESYKRRKELRQVPDRVDINRNLSVEHADLRQHYARLAQNPYTTMIAKSSTQNASYLRSIGSGSSPKPKSTVATSAAATTSHLLQRYKQSSHLMSASVVNLSSAGPLTQSTQDRRQPML